MTAKPGQGEALADRMLEVAEGLRETAGCDLYLINRSADEADVVWVTEQWRSQEELDAALQSPGALESIGQVRELIADGGMERVDLQPLGGAGTLNGETGFAIVNLDEVPDMAAGAGFGEMGEARFARTQLEAVSLGLSLQRLRPGVRQAFGHTHGRDEEFYVVIRGSGRVAIDDHIREVKPLDAIRVAPGSVRAFEAGPDGLEFLAMGGHHAGDAEVNPGYWPG
jgi:quinol monooxygenase YgiN/mannose-6-phosphate isomerase-like protein (cupin superfamily)